MNAITSGIHFNCATCGQKIAADIASAGQQTTCPTCAAIIIVSELPRPDAALKPPSSTPGPTTSSPVEATPTAPTVTGSTAPHSKRPRALLYTVLAATVIVAVAATRLLSLLPLRKDLVTITPAGEYIQLGELGLLPPPNEDTCVVYVRAPGVITESAQGLLTWSDGRTQTNHPAFLRILRTYGADTDVKSEAIYCFTVPSNAAPLKFQSEETRFRCDTVDWRTFLRHHTPGRSR